MFEWESCDMSYHYCLHLFIAASLSYASEIAIIHNSIRYYFKLLTPSSVTAMNNFQLLRPGKINSDLMETSPSLGESTVLLSVEES